MIVGFTTIPEAKRLADELVKHLGEGPLTPRELAAALGAQEAPTTLIEAFDAVLSLSAAAGDTAANAA